MEYTTLGHSGIRISKICLGCMGLSDPTVPGGRTWAAGADDARETIRLALEGGINFFDTAAAYIGAERRLGEALRAYAKRDEVVVATKFLPRTNDEIEAGVSVRSHILGSLDKSLAELGMDYVDLFICHMWDYGSPIEEVMAAMNEAVQSGKARAIGLSNAFAWQLMKANDLAERKGWAKFASMQGNMSLIYREEEREMVPCCRDQGMAYTCYSPLASGKLCRRGGADEATKRFKEDAYMHFKYDKTAAADQLVIDRVAELAEKRGVSMTEVSLAALIASGYVPIAGATKPSQIAAMVRSCDLTLSPEELAWLREPYVPHGLVGVMAQNGPAGSGSQTWSSPKIPAKA